ncbi:major facilitator superfamily domain-containing protein [Aspergillus bertholletiae]|uniref:Major facilitator superfamily domain-containing protein n=1 Tax=Aspergillus bertholletiae TaxID=1226010 RepID=A0A5N7BB89_9EURO|nr:major facilitator superfamily domain-containing protein [Aspergillus bertholletiae]
MDNWMKSLQRDRQQIPEVVIPLADAPNSTPYSEKDTESNVNSLDTQEKGAGSAPECSTLTLEALRAEVESSLAAAGHDSVYDRKAKIINKAIQDIGMGRYQWELFVLCGFGWTADNLWLQGIALTLTPLSMEFGISESYVRFTTCALFVGLIVGASFWGLASDIIGRRLAFNTTLFLCGAFGLASGGGSTWVGTCSLYACLGLGVGGNLPVDAAIFLEFLPTSSGHILSSLAVFWSVGTFIASMLAWAFIPNYSCSDASSCTKADNMGWRYLVLTLGAITMVFWICRFCFFKLYESPKFLIAKGRDDEAVAAIHGVAHRNKTKTWLTTEILQEIGGRTESAEVQNLSNKEILARSLSKFSMQQIGPLFSSKRLGITTVLIWLCWTTIGMGYTLFNAFLPQYLGSSASTSETYRNYAITSVTGLVGPILARYMVDIKYVGRKGTMAVSTLFTAILLFCFTAAKTPDTQLVCSALESFTQMIMYGVLYAYTPEVFPAPNRGTGTGIASCLNRIAGLCAPIIGIYASADPLAPIYASGALLLVSFVAMVLLPIETAGKQSL